MSGHDESRRPRLLEGHFLTAAIILCVSAVWMLAWGKKWFMPKKPVPWPEGTIITRDFRLDSLPIEFGPFVRAADDEMAKDDDDLPDGEIVLPDDELGLLRIGTSYDKSRYADRRSNWYLVRQYLDKRAGSVYPAWRLELYYYTGDLDAIPHTPERCLVAGGMKKVEAGTVTFRVPSARSPWDEPLSIHRVVFQPPDQLKRNQRYASYYILSFNGIPKKTRNLVRLAQSNPLVRYCYFAKIQFAPIGPVRDQAETDKCAEEFLNNVLPSVLKALPTAEDVKKLHSDRQQSSASNTGLSG